MSRQERIEVVMAQLRCSRAYAIEYLMEREYNQMSHNQAVLAVNEKLCGDCDAGRRHVHNGEDTEQVG